MHVLLAFVAFAAAPWAATSLTHADHGEPWLARVITAFAVATAVALRSGLRRWFGLVERGWYVAALSWLALVAARLV